MGRAIHLVSLQKDRPHGTGSPLDTHVAVGLPVSDTEVLFLASPALDGWAPEPGLETDTQPWDSTCAEVVSIRQGETTYRHARINRIKVYYLPRAFRVYARGSLEGDLKIFNGLVAAVGSLVPEDLAGVTLKVKEHHVRAYDYDWTRWKAHDRLLRSQLALAPGCSDGSSPGSVTDVDRWPCHQDGSTEETHVCRSICSVLPWC